MAKYESVRNLTCHVERRINSEISCDKMMCTNSRPKGTIDSKYENSV